MPSNGSDPALREPLGIYVHFPFCSIRCAYCDFPTVAGRDDRIAAYLDALDREIGEGQPGLPRRADSLFLGGGTPSRMEPREVARVVGAVRARFDLDDAAEVTLEGNPESLTRRRLDGYLEAGVNRISVGVQSLDDAVLLRAGRAHDAGEAFRALADARAAGIGNVSADLIAGLPGERLEAWGETVRRIADAGPDHVSVYLLETDKDTPMARGIRSGRLVAHDDDFLAAAYEETVSILEAGGHLLYEISNFARDGRRSRHNVKYWTDAPFAGFGNGAHGYVAGVRRANVRGVDAYVEAMARGEDPVDWSEPFDARRRLGEALFLGLRLREGVDLAALAARYGEDPAATWSEAWARAFASGLAERRGTRVRLTSLGRLCSNELFAEFV
jgi:oxygen-independent coproporphyrinogen-3 oxidase